MASLYEVLKHIRNFFPDTDKQITGQFNIEDGVLSPSPTLLNNQYYLIEGSTFNDNVYQHADEQLQDESFYGTVTPLKVPQALIELWGEIENYEANNKVSPYVSESFGGYSYTRGTTASGNVQGWANAFATKLNAWRKV